jgi:hypothetical protein
MDNRARSRSAGWVGVLLVAVASVIAAVPYREIIERGVNRGRNAMAVYQDLVSDHGFAPKYVSVRRFVARLRGLQTSDAHAVILTEPGQEGQVDYGEGPMVRDPETSKYRWTRLFVCPCAATSSAALVRLWALRQVDPLIRQLTLYRDHINRIIKENSDEPR